MYRAGIIALVLGASYIGCAASVLNCVIQVVRPRPTGPTALYAPESNNFTVLAPKDFPSNKIVTYLYIQSAYSSKSY